MNPIGRSCIENGPFRYYLEEALDPLGLHGEGLVLFSMLNPSMASATRNDPTWSRCCAFGRRWHFALAGAINPYGLRTPHPSELLTAGDRVGPGNARAIAEAIARASLVVLASGNAPSPRLAEDLASRNAAIVECAAQHGVPVRCLGLTGAGWPKHPLARGRHRVPDDLSQERLIALPTRQ